MIKYEKRKRKKELKICKIYSLIRKNIRKMINKVFEIRINIFRSFV